MTNPTTYNFSFYYYNSDHLGNNREVVDSAGTVKQVTNYYPFGAPYADTSATMNASLQPYKYNFSIEREKRKLACSSEREKNRPKVNFSIEREKRKLACSSEREKNRPKVNGKEFDKMHGLDTYDYGARQYAPILGRWDRMDPLCEKYYNISPYAYCHNNPIMFDPDGRDDYFNDKGEFMLPSHFSHIPKKRS